MIDPHTAAYPFMWEWHDGSREYSYGLSTRALIATEMAKGLLSNPERVQEVIDRCEMVGAPFEKAVAMLACDYADALIEVLNQPVGARR